MNNEKIIEIAIRYGCLELCNSRWVFSENGLRKFARVLIEEDRESVERQLNAYKTLVERVKEVEA